MKPIPPGYSEAADNAPIPGRPWWGVLLGGVARMSIPPQHRVSGFKRTDGAFVECATWQVDGEALDFPESVAAYDAAHPLPHPGYRAGQVWLRHDGTTEVVRRCINGRPYNDDARIAGGLMALGGCFLLHDALMPSRAPWGPA